MHERALYIDETNLGPDNAKTLATRTNLADAYRSAGQVEKAVALFEAILADSERMFGLDHRDTLISRNNVAYAYREAGRSDFSIALYEAALTDAVRVLSADHPDTLIVRTTSRTPTGRRATWTTPSQCMRPSSRIAFACSAPSTRIRSQRETASPSPFSAR
jgi:tetratricopeptide (TPR) repeat protein